MRLTIWKMRITFYNFHIYKMMLNWLEATLVRHYNPVTESASHKGEV